MRCDSHVWLKSVQQQFKCVYYDAAFAYRFSCNEINKNLSLAPVFTLVDVEPESIMTHLT